MCKVGVNLNLEHIDFGQHLELVRPIYLKFAGQLRRIVETSPAADQRRAVERRGLLPACGASCGLMDTCAVGSEKSYPPNRITDHAL